jgi:hypothetical protein
MMEISYLVPFEDLFEFFIRYRLWDKLSDNHHLKTLIQEQFCNPSIENQEAFEKFRRTWWEVSIPDNSSLLSQCIYVADSLRDALRLKPGINLSPWASSFEQLELEFDDSEDWIEEIDFTNSLVLE